MDITALKPSERIIEIMHPGKDDETPLGIRVTLMSLGDERLIKLKRRFLDERLKLEAKGKALKAEDIDENLNELAFGAMTDWEWYGDIDFKGTKNPPFTKANVLAVFKELGWFREQISEAIGDAKAFFIS